MGSPKTGGLLPPEGANLHMLRPEVPASSRAVIFLAAVLLLAVTALGQTAVSTGAIQGVVVDESGARVPGASITVRHVDSGAVRRVATDSEGNFAITGLPVGGYVLSAEKEGFSTAALEPFSVSIGQTVVRRIRLQAATVRSSVEVREQPEPIDAAATTSSSALGSERIEEAPSLNRNYLAFVLVAPGVAQSAGSKAQRSLAGLRSPNLDSGFSFGGMRGRNNGLSIDGTDNRDETTGGNRAVVGLEMVQEFRVAGAIIGAEFGGAAGGSVNVVTRSGTNIWHGDATFFFQNEALNARNPEALVAGRPRFRRYQPGTSLLGPLRKDKTFFAAAVEHVTERSQEWSGAAEDAVEVINAALSRPEFSRAPVRAVRRGLFPASGSDTTFSFKLDHRLPAVHALSVRYAFSRGRVGGEVYGLDNFADWSARASSLTSDHSLVASWLAVPGPALVSDFRVQLSRRSVGLTPNAAGSMLQIPGVVNLGQSYNADGSRTEDHAELVEGIDLIRGRHRLSAGASLHAVRLDARLANRFGGIFVFPTLEDFAAARPDVYVQAFGRIPVVQSTLPFGSWIQNRWQPAAGLTVETGLRFDAQWLPRPFPGPQRYLSPRFGIAWRPPGRPYVFRVGAGLFRDRYALAFLNDALQKDGVHGVEQYLAGEAAAQAFAVGLGGGLAQPLPGFGVSVYQPAADFPAAYARKLTAGWERSLGQETRLTVEFAQVRGFHLSRIRNARLTLPPAYALEQAAKSAYHGVSVSLHRRMHNNWTFLVGYTLGETRDDASDFDEHPMDPSNVRADWGPSRQHQLHRFAASALFDLPAERWQRLPGWLREALDEIVVAPIFQAGSARPLNALLTSDVYRTGAYPLSARPAGVGRNAFTGPSNVTLDLRIMKGIWLWEHRAILQFGAEAFNLLNHTNALMVSPYYAAGRQPLASFASPVETLNGRQIQLLAQLEF
jgi:hypothetical protein